MIVLRNPLTVREVTDPYIRELVTLRFAQVTAGEPYVYDRHGYMVVVQAGDTVQQLEQEIGLPILHGLFDDLPFGDPDFTPCFEILEEHQHEHISIFEMVFISNDDGAATALFIADTAGIDVDLLAMCRSFATPAVNMP
jgi:hypothetical protein